MIESMHSLDLNFTWEWKRVLRDYDEEYAFPEDLTQFMKTRYNFPTIYRWCVCKDGQLQPNFIYIGEAKKLYTRLKSYIRPGPTQETNKRLNSKFNQLEPGLVARMDYISFEKVNLGDFIIIPDDLNDKHTRKALEGLLICYYKKIYPNIMLNR